MVAALHICPLNPSKNRCRRVIRGSKRTYKTRAITALTVAYSDRRRHSVSQLVGESVSQSVCQSVSQFGLHIIV